MSEPTIIERLAAHKALEGVPREELEWLAAHGELHRYAAGTVIATPNRDADRLSLMIVLGGYMAVYVTRGTGRRKVSEWRAGDVSGALPYSRLQKTIGDVVIEEDSEIFEVPREVFRELTRECPEVTAVLVHAMLDRARLFASTDWQDEKLMSLGRLAAGLAHELNNPASAVSRSAKLLATTLPATETAAYELGAARLTDAERAIVDGMRAHSLIPATTGVFSAIERSDREDLVTAWLESRGIDAHVGEALAESGVGVDALDDLADRVSEAALLPVLRSLAAGLTARALASDIERASTKIHDLVSAVKRFTYMDRTAVLEPFNLAQGLGDTVAVLASKAKAKSVMIRLDVPPDLPIVSAYGGELNQVWSNIIENALDAVPEQGKIVVSAAASGERVLVRIVDDGPGIPADVKARIFDPFFTTKPIGQGTGLGLDIARRIVQRHQGNIDVKSEPGRTEFCVSLPRTPNAEQKPA
jgi:signal transduction histidine kinase